MDFHIPNYVNSILNRLIDNGFDAYIVGGCVRDLLIGREPFDYDITTSARPDEIEEVFKDQKTIQVGKEFGTIVVVQKEGNVEVTTFRTEGEYKDGRRPSEVSFSDDIVDDLSRRDFTINAMAYNRSRGLIDPFSGLRDLNNKIVKSVGDPKIRLKEDYLRILRSVRLATQLELNIEKSTYNACKEFSHYLKYISAERIREELFKILLSKKPSIGIKMMYDMNILEIIIPELIPSIDFDQNNPHHNRTLFEHICCVVDTCPAKLEIRMAALLHDIAKPMTKSIDEKGISHYYNHDRLGADIAKDVLLRLRCSNDFISKVVVLVRDHMYHSSIKEKGLKRELARVGEKNIFELYDLKKADMMCKGDKTEELEGLEEKIKQIEGILERKDPYNKSQLKINGNDIMELGFPKGKIVGEILDYLTNKVIENPAYNNREKLIELINENSQYTINNE